MKYSEVWGVVLVKCEKVDADDDGQWYIPDVHQITWVSILFTCCSVIKFNHGIHNILVILINADLERYQFQIVMVRMMCRWIELWSENKLIEKKQIKMRKEKW